MNSPAPSRMVSGTRVLVTGASGFIGSHLVDRLLSEGLRVSCFQHRTAVPTRAGKVQVIEGDLANPKEVQAAMEGVSTVFHLAGMASAPAAAECPSQAFHVNTFGTQTLLEAARLSSDVHVVLISTGHVYGSPALLPVTEEHSPTPGSIYAATKLAADVIAAGYHRSFGLPVTTLRLFNVYGPRQTPVAVIPKIIQQAIAEVEPQVWQLHPRRDFLYVDDAVEGMLRAARCPAAAGQQIILASGHAVSVAEIARRITTLVSGTQVDQPSDPDNKSDCIFGAIDKAQRLLAWRPRVSLNTGLERTISWWRAQLEAKGVSSGREQDQL